MQNELTNNIQTFGEGVTEIQTTPAVTHLSFSDRKQAEAFYNGFQNGKIPGINDGEGAAPIEVSWVAGSAAALPGSTSSSVNIAGNGGGGSGGEGLDSAMGDADGGENTDHHEGGGGDGKADQDDAGGDTQNESQAQNHQQSQQQQESGEAKAEVDYDVAGENEWDE